MGIEGVFNTLIYIYILIYIFYMLSFIFYVLIYLYYYYKQILRGTL